VAREVKIVYCGCCLTKLQIKHSPSLLRVKSATRC